MTEKEKLIKRLYDTEREFLLRIAFASAVNEADAEDLVQEVFIRAMGAAEELMGHPNPRAWLVMTLKNCIRNYSRLRANRSNIPLGELEEIAALENPEPLSHIIPEKLPAGDRELLFWRFEQRLSYGEISARLGISEGACRVKVCRIIRRCRKLMGK